MQGQFVNNEDKNCRQKVNIKEQERESNLVEHKENLLNLSRNYDNFVEQLKHKHGVIFLKMLYHEILSVLLLQRLNLEQLKRKNNKLRMFKV